MASFTLKTEKGLPTTQVVFSTAVDYITVVGAKTWCFQVAVRPISPTGNDYMFINQGLLNIRLDPPSTTDGHTQNILIVLEYGYTDKDKERIQEYAKSTAKASVLFIRTPKDLVDFLNGRKKENRSVRRLTFFSHGIPGYICLRYGALATSQTGNFGEGDVLRIDKNVFHYDAEVISYACRTGVGNETEAFTSVAQAEPEKSLAQFMATHWMVKVKAFQTRTLYNATYGNSTDAARLAEIKQMEREYIKQLDDYNQGKLKEKPYPPIGMLTMEEKKESIKEREKNKKAGGGPIMPLGAWNLPTSAPTPTGLKQ